jgi:hypothetical protein
VAAGNSGFSVLDHCISRKREDGSHGRSNQQR